jgi:hypothetical protein
MLIADSIKKVLIGYEQVGMMLSGMGYRSPNVFSQVNDQCNHFLVITAHS